MQPIQMPNGDLVIPLEGYITDGCHIDLIGRDLGAELSLYCSKADNHHGWSAGDGVRLSMYYFEICANGAVRKASAKCRSDWPAACELLGLAISNCHISGASGILTVEFENGIHIRVLPLERVEHWEVLIDGAPGYTIISMPGEGFDWWGGPDQPNYPLGQGPFCC
jgi:hypothetical protein